MVLFSAATVGSDVWALAWMRTWWRFDSSSEAQSPGILYEAFESVRDSSCWQYSNTRADSSSTSDHNGENATEEAYLHPGTHKSSIFPFSDEITTSFYPMIYKQFEGSRQSSFHSPHRPRGRGNAAGPPMTAVYQYFESSYGRWFDSDGDGVQDSYQYNTALKDCQSEEMEECSETGDYSVWATGNLLVGMLLPYDDLNYLRRVFEGQPFSQQRKYPKVSVRSTAY
jgi:hypothetical protein